MHGESTTVSGSERPRNIAKSALKPALLLRRLLRRLDIPGLRRARRESRRRSKLGVKRPLHNRVGRLLNLCHRHRPPSPAVATYLESREQDNQLSPIATSGINLAARSAPTATATLDSGSVKRRYWRAAWLGGTVWHRGVKGYRFDCSTSPAPEKAQRRRQAAPTAIERRRSRRRMSSAGHRCR
jgi:hypothetical protein